MVARMLKSSRERRWLNNEFHSTIKSIQHLKNTSKAKTFIVQKIQKPMLAKPKVKYRNKS